MAPRTRGVIASGTKAHAALWQYKKYQPIRPSMLTLKRGFEKTESKRGMPWETRQP